MNLKRVIPAAIVVLLLFVFCVSCGRKAKRTFEATVADSLMNAAYAAHDYDGLLALADSLQTAGGLPEVEAEYWRGYACYRLRQVRRSEMYWKKAVAADVKNAVELEYYSKAVSRLASLLLLKDDYEGTLRLVMPAVEKIEEMGGDTISDFSNLLISIGTCQLNLGMSHEAAAIYEQAFQRYKQAIRNDKTDAGYKSAIISLVKATDNYLSNKQFEDARKWTERFEEVLTQYENSPVADLQFADKQRTRLYLYQATMLQGLGETKAANEAYRNALSMQYAKTGDGRIEGTDYLMAAQRWREAADNFRDLDAQVKRYGFNLSLDVIQQLYLPKYRANMGAGRRDSALAVGWQICQALDSAIVEQKRNDAAELATVYETQQKEAQIAQQQAALSRLRWVSTLVAFVLIMAFLVVYILARRKSTHRLKSAHQRLEEAHSKLQSAYDRLEETTTVKERIESELRIARNIQQSMVPSVFPEHERLDLYASMTPAREVGGDLYDYLLADDMLYFCLGDVSGKGIPASLFMAQASRLFRAFAKEKMMPADIATRINAELTEGNESGMFITMFIGLVDLKTGRLQYCNCGHNPPVISIPSEQQETGCLYTPHYLEMESNAPLGLWPDLDYVGEQVDDITGKLLFVYTDGLNEAENRQQEQFGEERLLEMLRVKHYENCRQAIGSFMEAIEKHRDGAEPNDDLTMLCLYVKQQR